MNETNPVKIAIFSIIGILVISLFFGSFFTVQPGTRAFTVTF